MCELDLSFNLVLVTLTFNMAGWDGWQENSLSGLCEFYLSLDLALVTLTFNILSGLYA